MKYSIGSLAVAVSLTVLAACAGSGSSVTPRAHESPAATAAKASVAFAIKVPGKYVRKTDRRRTPAYIGPTTASASIVVTAVGASAATLSTDVPCSDTCATTLSLTPGTYTFAVTLYDGPGGTGSVLSAGSANKTIVAGVANVVNLSFTGSVAGASVTLDAAGLVGEFDVGTPSNAVVTIDAVDADGNTIVGAYDKPIVLTSSDGVNAPINCPAPTVASSPGFDSTPYPAASNQPSAASVTIVSSDQMPVVMWSGNQTTAFDVRVTASVTGVQESDVAVLSIVGGGTPPPDFNPSDGEPTPVALQPVSGSMPSPTVSPTTTIVGHSGSTLGGASPFVAGNAVPLSTLGPAGSNPQYGFVGGSATKIILGLSSQSNVEAAPGAMPGVLQQLNFRLTVNGSGLNTFAKTRDRVIDLNRSRNTRLPENFEFHPTAPPLLPLGHATAARSRYAAASMPIVGMKQTLHINNAAEPSTVRAIVNDQTTGNPRIVIWTADSSSVPDSIISTYAQQAKNSDAALSVLLGSFHYPSNAPGIKMYNACDTSGNKTGTASGVIADPGYISIFYYDSAGTGLPAGFQGYFNSISYLTQSTLNCVKLVSDEMPIINIRADPGIALTPAQLNYQQATITHEMGHLLTYVIKNLTNDGGSDAQWLLEGFGTELEDYTSVPAINGDDGPIGAPTKPVVDNNAIFQTLNFFGAPQNYSLTGFAGLDGGSYANGGGSNYGLSYLFLKYCTDRFGTGFIRSLIASSAVGTANITYAAQQNGGGNITYAQLFTDFTTMLAVSNTGTSNDPRYNMQSFPIRNATFPAQCMGCYGQYIAGPATVGTLTAAQSAVVQNMFPGGFAFFTMNGIDPSGNTIRLDDDNSGALNLFGALGQQ